MPRSVYHLSDITAAGLKQVRFKCSRCDRHGAYRTSTLVERFGPDASMVTVFSGVAADCPRRIKPPADVMDRCDLRCPSLRVVAGLAG